MLDIDVNTKLIANVVYRVEDVYFGFDVLPSPKTLAELLDRTQACENRTAFENMASYLESDATEDLRFYMKDRDRIYYIIKSKSCVTYMSFSSGRFHAWSGGD